MPPTQQKKGADQTTRWCQKYILPPLFSWQHRQSIPPPRTRTHTRPSPHTHTSCASVFWEKKPTFPTVRRALHQHAPHICCSSPTKWIYSPICVTFCQRPPNIRHDRDVLSASLPTNDLCSPVAAAQRTASILPNMQQCAHGQSPHKTTVAARI